ncbi:MAG: hypothetical protein HYW47_05245, partial [Deltaproteobacteria bacterium]|nr:hypothetical protein [Deltaproteobacteria bacterium]
MGYSTEPFFEKDLSKLIEKMESLTLSALIKIPGMQEKRADIILAGAVLLDEIL